MARRTVPISLGELIVHDSHLAEVITGEGVEVDLPMVEEFHAALQRHLEPPYGLLVNRKHSYTYTFEAQQEIGRLQEIHAIAVVATGVAAEVATRTVAALPSHKDWVLEIFSDRDKAVAWLRRVLAVRT